MWWWDFGIDDSVLGLGEWVEMWMGLRFVHGSILGGLRVYVEGGLGFKAHGVWGTMRLGFC